MRSPFILEFPISGQDVESNQPEGYVFRSDAAETVYAVGQIRATLSKGSGVLNVDVPFTTADQLYYSKQGGKLRISNDLRVLADRNYEIDPRGIYSLLQFGATIPPITPWKEISEFVPGRLTTIQTDGDLCLHEETSIVWPLTESFEHSLDPQIQFQTVSELIDRILIEACPSKDPVILFSGGVDSGVLAARVAAMGWKDATLVNYSFGSDDEESVLAERMAKHLGLSFVRTGDGDHDALEVLDSVATTFMRPFGDPSSAPTFALARAVIDRFSRGRVVLDGTGADGAFGLFPKVTFYRKLDHVPQLIRRSAGYIYGTAGLWRTASRIERATRILRRSSQLPMFLAGIARNPLDNIAYHFQPETRFEILDLIRAWVTSAVSSSRLEARLPAADLALNCSRVLAQKTKSVFNGYGQKVVYPFLDDRLVGLALRRACFWPGRDEPKMVLKRILGSHVPTDMVYRPKSPFVGPYRIQFSRPEFLSKYDRLLEEKSALTEFVNLPILKQLRTKIQSREPLPDQTYWFVWSAVFVHCWFGILNDRDVNSD